MVVLYGTIAQAVVLLPIEGGTTLGLFEQTNSWKNLHQEPLKFSWYQPAPLPMTWDQFAPEAKVSLPLAPPSSSGFTLFEAKSVDHGGSFIGYQRPPEPVASMPGPTTLATWTPETTTGPYPNASDTISTKRRSLGLMATSVSPIGPGNHGYDPNRVAVPEIPQGTLLAAGGLLGLAGLRRRFRRK